MRLLNKIYILFLAAATLTACSNIDEDERFIYVRPANVSRAVLIEDFTGQRCVNCPNANDAIHELQAQYGDSNVIAVGIHSGPLGFKGNAKVKGLATDLGNDYYDHFGAMYQPVGMVNRHGLSNYPEWQGLVASEIEKEPEASLELHSVYDSTSRTAGLSINVISLDNAINGKLQVWIIEDSITALQKMPDGSTNRQYIHNHVLRDAVNGEWGSDISIAAKGEDAYHYSYTLPDDFVARNCSFVVFAYNDEGVIQAAKIKIDR